MEERGNSRVVAVEVDDLAFKVLSVVFELPLYVFALSVKLILLVRLIESLNCCKSGGG